jgi:LuxR family maltose regulon positive regulatory protein
MVPRRRLTQRLERGAAARLLIVSAPAGFGKTTLLTEWLTTEQAGRRVAWLALDAGDNDSGSFWAYVVEALAKAAPGAGESARSLLDRPQPAPAETILTALLNDLSRRADQDIILVLDDYHVIGARDVHDALAFLLDHSPPHLHVVIATRADPPLPLARLRARGELTEVRARDLRFTAGEAAAYLNETMGLRLADGDVAALEARTEGWIAALQLAALSMRGREDPAGFIAGFAGDDRYVVDYLAEEVLHRQDERVREFLLRTSVLDRLSGPLCDAVTGQGGGRAMLEALDRGNLFVVPLDDRRQWYRYHRLFADALQAHLRDERPAEPAGLHRRASDWFEQHGERAAAIGHALAGEDFRRAADLVERAIPAVRQARQEAALHGWLAAIPDAEIRARPVLSAALAGALLASGVLEGVEGRLRDAERWLTGPDGTPAERPAGLVVADEDEYRRLPGGIELYRAALSIALGDPAAAVRHARQALDRATEDDHLCRSAASGLLALVFWSGGDLEGAHRAWAECSAGLERAGHVSDVLGCAIALADIRIEQGRLAEARHTCERALQLADGQPTNGQRGPVVRGTPDMHVALSEIDAARGDLRASAGHLQRSRELGEHNGLPQHRYRWRVAAARLRQAEGDLDGALALLGEAEQHYVSDFFPNVRPVPALRARVLVAQGRAGEARAWARERGLSAADDLSYLREFEHVTLARVLLAEHPEQDAAAAAGLLDRLLAAAEQGGRTRRVIEILALRARAHEALGEMTAARACRERAAELAAPEGLDWVLAAEDAPPAGPARRPGTPGTASAPGSFSTPDSARPASAAGPALAEPLSERELDVLRLLASELDGPAIARELSVSLNTLRTHTRHIYAKLGVTSRRAAVRRAAELGLPRR